MRPPAVAFSRRNVMRQKKIPALVSGAAITLLASFTLWQLLAVGLLVRAMLDIFGILGCLF
jgi:hypothetical protein